MGVAKVVEQRRLMMFEDTFYVGGEVVNAVVGGSCPDSVCGNFEPIARLSAASCRRQVHQASTLGMYGCR